MADSNPIDPGDALEEKCEPDQADFWMRVDR